MNRSILGGLAVLLMSCASSGARAADSPAAPYSVTVEADVHYAADGTLETLSFVEPGKQPAGFLAMVEKQVKGRNLATIPHKPLVGTFDTGMLVTIVVTPRAGGADARVGEIKLLPRILRRTMVPFPRDIVESPQWEGKLTGQCVVGVDGRCTRVSISSEDPGMPPSGRRFVTESLAKWRFKPQRVDGKPIEFILDVPFILHATDAPPPEFFGGPRL